MTVGDVDLQTGVAVVRLGKGGKGRSIPSGPQTARAIAGTYGPGGLTAWPPWTLCGSGTGRRGSATRPCTPP